MIDSPELILTLPKGLVGLPEERGFALSTDAGSGLMEMRSTRRGGLDFYAAQIDRIRPGLRELLVSGGHAGADDVVLVLLSVHGEPPVLTANLAGPIVVDSRMGIGRQLVLEGDEFPLRAPLSAPG